jgi:hypothetical protein
MMGMFSYVYYASLIRVSLYRLCRIAWADPADTIRGRRNADADDRDVLVYVGAARVAGRHEAILRGAGDQSIGGYHASNSGLFLRKHDTMRTDSQ